MESTDVMYINESGETTTALVANWVDGVKLLPMLSNPNPSGVTVTDADGNMTELSLEEIENAVIAMVRDSVTLVLPDRGRSAWLTNIVEIESN